MRTLLGTALILVLIAPCAAGGAVPPEVQPVPSGPAPQAPPLPLGEAPPLGRLPTAAPGAGLATIARRPLPNRALVRATSDGRSFINLTDRAIRDAALDRTRMVGATTVRLPLSWNRVEGRRAPTDARDPADPAYNFAELDGAIRAATARGLAVSLTSVEAPPPREGRPDWAFAPPGTWAPDPTALARFTVAAARRYSGRFPDPQRPGRTLPRVATFQVWNEPNLPVFLGPQWVAERGRWVPFAPRHYREMLAASYSALKTLDPGLRVVAAGTAPIGEPRDGEGRMTPVRFWRALLCLDRAPCPEPVRADAIAHHPLSVGDPAAVSRGPQDAAVADLDRVLRLVRRAGDTGRLDPRRPDVLVTELNWDSGPGQGVPAERLAHHVAGGLYLLWRQGVAQVTWQFLRDPISRPGDRPHPAGLWRIDRRDPLDPARDRPKPAVRALRQPFVALRRAGHVRVWAHMARGRRRAVVQERRHGGWERRAGVTVAADGLVSARISVPPGRRLLRITDPRTGRSSAAWQVTAAPTRWP